MNNPGVSPNVTNTKEEKSPISNENIPIIFSIHFKKVHNYSTAKEVERKLFDWVEKLKKIISLN